jgi:hypothetical protein
MKVRGFFPTLAGLKVWSDVWAEPADRSGAVKGA